MLNLLVSVKNARREHSGQTPHAHAGSMSFRPRNGGGTKDAQPDCCETTRQVGV